MPYGWRPEGMDNFTWHYRDPEISITSRCAYSQTRIPTVTLLFVIVVCSSPAHVRNFCITVFFLSKLEMCIRFSKMVGFNLTAATVTIHCLKLCCFIMQFDTVIHAQKAATWSKTSL